MSKQISLETLKASLKEAGDGFDFKALAANAISALESSEKKGANAITEVSQLAEQLNIASNTIKTHEATIVELNDSLKEQQELTTAALEQVSELGKQVELQQNNTDGGLIVTVNGQPKKLVGNRFTIPGHGKFTAKELAQRADLLETLAAKGSGALVDVK